MRMHEKIPNTETFSHFSKLIVDKFNKASYFDEIFVVNSTIITQV